tara:strand:+ start:69 stop:401 length:333 start_codon:yes stop_codon:yes gene_type:complete
MSDEEIEHGANTREERAGDQSTPTDSSGFQNRVPEFIFSGARNALNRLDKRKYIRTTIFVVFVFFILRTLGKILDFFSIDSTSVHTYFFWYSILLFFFVILPVKSKTTTN